MQKQLYKFFEQKASKIRKKYLKNEKIINTSIDSVRGFTNYHFVKKLLKDKSFATLIEDKHNAALFNINGTGIKVRVIARDAKIYYEAFAMCQYYRSDNAKNRAELEKWILKSEICSVDIAFDSENMIKLPRPIEKIVGDTTYYVCEKHNSPFLKICNYNKSFKAKCQNTAKKMKFPTQSGNLYRLEFTILYSPKHLNKNKKLHRPHSKSARIKGAKSRLLSLIENYLINNNTRDSKKNYLNTPTLNLKMQNKFQLKISVKSVLKKCLKELHLLKTGNATHKMHKKKKKLYKLLTNFIK